MARTANEEARRKRLATIKSEVRQRELVSTHALDYSLLPVETKVRLCIAEYDEAAHQLVINDDANEVCALTRVKSAELTLRQAKFGTYTPRGGKPEVVAMELRLVHDGGRRTYHKVAVDNIGRSLYAVSQGEKFGYAGKHLAADIQQCPQHYTFLAQHTIQFPATYYGRDKVSFLGLPRDTIVPLKNGGEFKVVRREVGNPDAHGNVDGNLVMVPLDDKAKKLGDAMGWAFGGGAFIVPPNLYTGKSGGNSFDVARIKVPYRDPFDNQRILGAFGPEARLKYPNGKASALAAASIDPVADSLENLLFG